MSSLRISPFSPFQLTITTVSTIIGVAILTLPRVIAEEVGTPDVWIDVILGGIITAVAAMICLHLSNCFPGETFYIYNVRIVGKVLGTLISVLYICNFTTFGAFEARVQAEVVRHFLLDETPLEITMLAFILVGFYLVSGGLNAIIRINEFYLPITLLIVFTILFLNWKNFEFDNIRPFLENGPSALLPGILPTAQAFSGFDVILFLVAYTRNAQKSTLPILLGFALVTLIYMTIVIMVIGSLTLNEVITLTWPTMEFVKQIEFPGAFFEHFEIFFITIWLLNMFTTFFINLYLASLGIHLLIGWNIKLVMCLLLPVIYGIALLPKDLNGALELGKSIGFFSVLVSTLIPLFLLLIAIARNRPKHDQPVNEGSRP
ncbi:GerAB/ArcD/ProY family transporter [Brevibacillus sp. FSL L8-0520]|uniref:GerAB/ArcD/ProY family transporter n=1 Tax=Brevibacillus TaxID=55080 RepID=UPI001FA953AA|nr:GerAB/ArcD/ProY family transporter [Brevibacillus borstelensis]